jgi:aspartate-semialdehyde dehydrogenase
MSESMTQNHNSETLDIKGAAELMRIGFDAMRQLVLDGHVEAVILNQKHAVLLREVVIAYIRDEGRRQAEVRRRRRIKPAHEVSTDAKLAPRSRRRPPPNLDGYEFTTSQMPNRSREG